jgi:hypothetical protein
MLHPAGSTVGGRDLKESCDSARCRTLSPMDSFEKELGCKFSVTMEGSHVIDMDKQASSNQVSTGVVKCQSAWA